MSLSLIGVPGLFQSVSTSLTSFQVFGAVVLYLVGINPIIVMNTMTKYVAAANVSDKTEPHGNPSFVDGSAVYTTVMAAPVTDAAIVAINPAFELMSRSLLSSTSRSECCLLACCLVSSRKTGLQCQARHSHDGRSFRNCINRHMDVIFERWQAQTIHHREHQAEVKAMGEISLDRLNPSHLRPTLHRFHQIRLRDHCHLARLPRVIRLVALM